MARHINIVRKCCWAFLFWALSLRPSATSMEFGCHWAAKSGFEVKMSLGASPWKNSNNAWKRIPKWIISPCFTIRFTICFIFRIVLFTFFTWAGARWCPDGEAAILDPWGSHHQLHFDLGYAGDDDGPRGWLWLWVQHGWRLVSALHVLFASP